MDPIETPTNTPQSQPSKQKQTVEHLVPINFSWQLKLALIGLGIVLFVLMVVSLLPKNRTTRLLASPLPTTSSDTQATPSGQLSAYSQTETFGQFLQQLDAYKARLESLDLSENTLSFPLLDFDVQFDSN